MPPIIILETPEVTVRYHPEGKIIHHEMHGDAHGKDFRDALMAGLEAMKKYGATKWLSDDSKLVVLNTDDRIWGEDVWLPAVIAAGWKYWALVEPERAIARVRLEERAETFSKQGVTVRSFTTPDEAMKWLASQS